MISFLITVPVVVLFMCLLLPLVLPILLVHLVSILGPSSKGPDIHISIVGTHLGQP